MRWLYPESERDGSALVAGKERDGVFVTDDLAVAIEATMSKTPGKAKSDAQKLVEMLQHFDSAYPDKAPVAFFVTPHDPTEHQRSAVAGVAGRGVTCLSLDTLRSRIINVGEYLACRDEAPFGSARHPGTSSTKDLGEYAPMDLVDFEDESRTYPYGALVDLVSSGSRGVVVGDYGAGKSMTLRETYRKLAQRYRTGAMTQTFPVHLNMREHQGQTNPVEALERHARNIGFSNPEKLVRAWRAGMCILLLDGFDEISSSSIAGGAGDSDALRTQNYNSSELLRRFVRESPVENGILLSGRNHFFRNVEELRSAIALPNSVTIFSLSDFTSSQVNMYLARQGWSASIPSWLPRRPLLVGWLATREVLADTVDVSHLPEAEGWDWLLSAIMARDAEIEGGIDGETLRMVSERIATKLRSSVDGLGPIYHDDIRESFREVLGYAPTDQQEVLLRRLPGLGVANPSIGSRQFIDASLAATARAGDLVRHIELPDSYPLNAAGWRLQLEGVGIDVAVSKLERRLESKMAGSLSNALKRASRQPSAKSLAADIFFIAINGVNDFEVDFPLLISEIQLVELRLGDDDIDLSAVTFQDCLIDRLELSDVSKGDKLPTLRGCSIGVVDGVARPSDLPLDKMVSCNVDKFSKQAITTNALVAQGDSVTLTIGLTVLRKLFAQRGAGRKEDGLRNGLPLNQRQHVPAVLHVLQSAGLAVPSRRGTNTIWLPNRVFTKQVRSWLTSPGSAKGDVIERLRSLAPE